MEKEYDKLIYIIKKTANSISYNRNKYNNETVLNEIFNELNLMDKTNKEKLKSLEATLRQRVVDTESNWSLSKNYKDYYQILAIGLDEIAKGNQLPDFHVTRPYEWFTKIKNNPS